MQCKFAKHENSRLDWSFPMLKLTRWTIAHRRIVVVAWIVLAIGVLAVSQAVGKRSANNFSLPNTDSQRAVDLL
jgi:RND superfamily putative drug exporter